MRGEVVRDYLADVWGIDTSRMQLLPPRGYPQFRSNPKDPLGIVENRRAEVRTDDWELLQPVVTQDTKPVSDLGDSTLDVYTLIMFRFDSPEMGPVNERVVRDHILTELRKGAKVEVTGYTDVTRRDDRALKLHASRANTVINAIRRCVRSDMIASLSGRGFNGESDLLYSNDLPEGRFYNRGVQVRVWNAKY